MDDLLGLIEQKGLVIAGLPLEIWIGDLVKRSYTRWPTMRSTWMP